MSGCGGGHGWVPRVIDGGQFARMQFAKQEHFCKSRTRVRFFRELGALLAHAPSPALLAWSALLIGRIEGVRPAEEYMQGCLLAAIAQTIESGEKAFPPGDAPTVGRDG